MAVRSIQRARKPLCASFVAPPSKSVTHRALIAAALASGASVIERPLAAEDTRCTRSGLQALGIEIEELPEHWIVHGLAGEVPGGGRSFLGNSGSSLRFLAAVACLGSSPSLLDGSERLRQRPLKEIAEALTTLGGAIVLSPSGGLPLRAGGQPMHGASLHLAADRSSQFASALLLIASRVRGGVDLTLRPPVVSLPYIELTAGVLQEFGVSVTRSGAFSWRVSETDYRGRHYRVEGDHSSASYWLLAPAIAGGRVRVVGLSSSSLQPDRRLGRLLEQLGCVVTIGEDWLEVEGGGAIPAFDVDMKDAPDLVPTLAMLALFAEGPCVLRHIAHLRHKESDRLEGLARNIRNLGREASATNDCLQVGPKPRRLTGGLIATAGDHRLAMAFAIAGLRLSGIALDDATCVSKSHPDFWPQFGRLEG